MAIKIYNKTDEITRDRNYATAQTKSIFEHSLFTPEY